MKSQSPISQPVTPDHCAAALMETIHPVMQFVRSEMRRQREPSLSVPQFRVLAFLSQYPGSSLSEVADHLGVTRATASAMTDRLVQRGLLHRAEDPAERRHIMLKLTQAGSDRLNAMQAATQQRIATLLAERTPEELSHLAAGLTVLAQVFQSPENPDKSVGRDRDPIQQ